MMIVRKLDKKFPYVSNKVVKVVKVDNWIPTPYKVFKDINTNSWYDHKYYDNPNSKNIPTRIVEAPIIPPESLKQQMRTINKLQKRKTKDKNKALDKKPVFITTRKIRFYPSKDQISILNTWFDAFAKVFNSTIHYIRNTIFINGKLIEIKDARKNVNFYDIRKKLSDRRNEIQKNTEPNKIPVHILDEAIHLAVSNYKTCITNYYKGYIKKFRIREWSNKRRRMIIKIEKNFFRNGTFCSSIFNSVVTSRKLNNIQGTVTLQYNSDTKKYILLVPIGIKNKIKLNNPKDDCGIDLGVRTFASVYSQNGTQAICNRNYVNGYDTEFKKYHKKIYKINQLMQSNDEYNFVVVKRKINNKFIETIEPKNIKKTKLRKALRKNHNKIVNKVKDMHYKVAHELVNTYDNIYIGKLSTCQILSRRNKKISKLTKRMIGVLSPYLFRQRLIYMGYKYGSLVEEVSEYLTTKTCSNCGKINEIGKSKTYKCKCGMKTDRDENSAKNHLKLGLAKRMGILLKKVASNYKKLAKK